MSQDEPRRTLRTRGEMPFFVFMVVLNVLIVVGIIRAAAVLTWLPDKVTGTAWADGIRWALIALLLLVPALIVIRETRSPASTRGTAVELSPSQFPEIYETAEDFASELGLRRRPDIFLANGNGALNAFAAQATGHDYVVLSNELFANLYHNNRERLRFILGHGMGHIKLNHVALWYQIAVAYSQPIPILGQLLSRLREYSADRNGAYVAPNGAAGLVVLASGRHTETGVNVKELVEQGRKLRGFWVWPRSCRGRTPTRCGGWRGSRRTDCSSKRTDCSGRGLPW